MILFRVRKYGSAEWTLISVNTPGIDEEEEDDMSATIAAVIGSALGTSSLHVQRMADEGDWEDIE